MKLRSIKDENEVIDVTFDKMAEQLAVAADDLAQDYLTFYNILIYLFSVVFIVSEIAFFLWVEWDDYEGLEVWIICLGIVASGIFFIINIVLMNKSLLKHQG